MRLLASFASHTPLDDEERRAIAHLERLVASVDDAFLRSTLPTHVTSSAVVLDPTSRRVLLHLHRRLDRWLQPGGHLEPGERPEDAAIRETLEETGIAVRHPSDGPKVVHLDEHPGPDGHVHLDLRYLLLAEEGAPRAGEGEHTGQGPGPTLRWVDATELAMLADRSLVRAIEALARTSP